MPSGEVLSTVPADLSTNHVQLPVTISLLHDEVLFATPHQSKQMEDYGLKVWSVPFGDQSAPQKPRCRATLSGHSDRVTASCFHKRGKGIVVASTDAIVFWELNFEGKNKNLFLAQELGRVAHLTIGRQKGDKVVCACINRAAFILHLGGKGILCKLDGHDAPVTSSAFLYQASTRVVTVSEDRTFKVWDLESHAISYQSSVLCADPLVSLAVDSESKRCVIGNSSGRLYFFEANDETGVLRQKHELTLRSSQKSQETEDYQDEAPYPVISARSSNSDSSKPPVWQPDDDDVSVDMVAVPLDMIYAEPATTSLNRDTQPLELYDAGQTSMAKHLREMILIVALPEGFVFFDAYTFREMKRLSLANTKEWVYGHHTLAEQIPTAGSCSLIAAQKIVSLLGSAFGAEVTVASIEYNQPHPSASETATVSSAHPDVNPNQLTMLSSSPLTENSPLKATMRPKTPVTTKSSRGRGRGRGKTRGGIKGDQPVTFRRRIHSSGYGSEAPRQNMFQPRTKKPPNGKKSKKKPSEGGVGINPVGYPVDGDPPTNLVHEYKLACSGILGLSISDDGQYIAAGFADASVQIMKSKSKAPPRVLSEHKGAVTDISWSTDSKYLLTSSADSQSLVWDFDKREIALKLDLLNHNIPKKEPEKQKPMPPLIGAKFYYKDKFFVTAYNNSLSLYKYYMDSTTNDLKRYESKSRYKRVSTVVHPAAQSVTALGVVNSFYSHLCLVGGSDKSLCVMDMNLSKPAASIADAHSRPIHTIRCNNASAFVTHPSEAYDLILTAAVGDGVHLWDLRTQRCVRRFTGFSNRAHKIGIDFSPCGRYIATGSENRSAYIFDLRTNAILHQLSKHKDVVTDVKFHPQYPQLFTSCLDGVVRVFSSD